MSTQPLHRAADVAAAIFARVAKCTIAQGAETDLGARVFQGRRHIDDSMPPCATIVEAEDTPARKQGVRGEYEIAQRYVLFAYVPCDPNDPNLAAHAAIRDMKRCLFSTDGKLDTRLGGALVSLDYVGRDIGPRADGAAFVVAAVEVVATYVERLNEP